ncbi:MAG: sigma-70 family RNA polymerase sigma factor [Acidimicrobiia bacterium]|nr:sigma-70 family RNA polymerase sigma factor [Acidimicrobiia bacterium]
MSRGVDSVPSDPADRFLRRLHREHGSALYGWALQRMGDPRDAEEAVAETLVKAWRSHEQYDPGRGEERAWLFGILRNTATDHYRAARRHLRVVDGHDTDQPEDSDVDRLVESSLVREAILELSEQHRQVIVEAYYEGRTVSEIADRLEVPAGTVKSRLFYGMRRLRSSLEERGMLDG